LLCEIFFCEHSDEQQNQFQKGTDFSCIVIFASLKFRRIPGCGPVQEPGETMLFRRWRQGVLCLAPLVVPLSAWGSVSLILTDKDATPGATSVTRGSTFAVSVMMKSSTANTADQVTGVDYWLQASTNGIFAIASRNTGASTGTAFPFTLASDSDVVNVYGPALNPTNGGNLGGETADQNQPVFNNTFEVADYVISVSAAALPGTYTITTFDQPGYGYAGIGPAFNESNFSSEGTFSVTVQTPEPAALTMLALAGLLTLTQRRRER
jgi:hypothetical protein